MKREAFKAVGNPLLMGGPVLFSRDLSGGGGPTPEPPQLVTAAVLTLSPDGNTLTYTAGVWTGVPTPTVTATLNTNNGPTGIPVTPGTIPVQPAWRGDTVSVLESATNDGGVSSRQQVSNFVPIPAAAPTLDQQVEAILAGRAGTVFDLSDNDTRFQDEAGTIPITASGQPVARVKSKWGTLAYAFSTATTTRWPAAAFDGIIFDGVDDNLTGVAANLGFMNNAAFITSGVSFEPADVTRANGTLLYFSRNGSGNNNWMDFMIALSGLRYVNRRSPVVNADPVSQITSANGTMVNGVKAVALMETDYAGTGRLEARLNGVQLPGVALAGIIGNSEANNSQGTSLGSVNVSTSRFFGKISKVFLARFELTPAELATVEAWLAEVPPGRTDAAGRITMENWVQA